MRPRKFLVLASAVLAGVLAVPAVALAGQPAPTATSTSSASVESVPVSFTVANTNHTSVACSSDGKTYTIRGHIVAPAGALAHPDAATLYLHAVTQGEFYWNFTGVPGYDYANQQAANGHVSVTIDRLGYGSSDKPPGLGSCFGSQADTAHQVVQALRSGHYQTGSGSPVAFPHVFLAGHSAGGLTATIEAYSFHDIDGLINFGWADQTTAPFTVTEVADTNRRCALAALGLYRFPGAPPNYTPFGTDRDRILFHSATPDVRAAVPTPAADPCGDLVSIPLAIGADLIGVPQTTGPVLIIGGTNDALFPPPALALQAARYTGSSDVTYKEFANTAHGFNYEATHLQTLAAVDKWLHDHGA